MKRNINSIEKLLKGKLGYYALPWVVADALWVQSDILCHHPQLMVTIERECTNIPRELFHDVRHSIASRCQQCLEQNGHQFENMR